MTKDMRKKCLECGHPKLLVKVTVTKMVPAADRGGGLKLGGVKIGQVDMKWSHETIGAKEDTPEQKIRGPYYCEECETEHYFVVGAKRGLRKGSLEAARAQGHAALMAED